MRSYARDMNLPVRVSMRRTSSLSMYSGTCTWRPVSSTAFFVRAVAEAARMDGSHETTLSATVGGSSTVRIFPFDTRAKRLSISSVRKSICVSRSSLKSSNCEKSSLSMNV